MSMLTLAIETSTKTAGIALLGDTEIIAEIFLNTGVHHSVVLLPAIENIFKVTQTKAEQVDLFACASGPGSFTGIRIGISTIKGLALATGKPVVGVSTLEALAFNVIGSSSVVCPMLDAKKKQIYAALYRAGRGDAFEKIVGERVADVEEFLKCVEEETIFLGDGALKYSKVIKNILPGKAYFASGFQNHIRASAVALIGKRKYHEGDAVNPFTLTPAYLRASEAELARSIRESS
jgi:tRNA threonylcarbamoyladenosine biosynthesis protein TsaB